MKYLKLAFSFLSVLPVRLKEAPVPGDLGRAAAWYPLVGLVIGGILAGLKWALDLAFPSFLSAGLVVAAWVILTGGLHLDGLADCCDGLLNASSPERRLEIMHDPRLGSFGGVGLALTLLLKMAAVASLPQNMAAGGIVLAAVCARFLLLLARWQPMARPGGLGADFTLGLNTKVFAAAAVLPLGVVFFTGWHGALAAAAAFLTALAVFGLARRRLGGLTGDVLGLLVELSELTALLVFCARWPF